MRVDETLEVRFEDVTVVLNKNPKRLYVWVRGGKLRYRKGPTEIIGLPGAVSAFDRLKTVRYPHISPPPNDLLFPKNPRETIQEVLTKSGLLFDQHKKRRTAKSFRHTYIMASLRYKVNLFAIAKNCRTSVDMIEQYYGSHATARMNQDELTKMFAQVKPEGRSK
jgi:integrase